ncbi:L,D-transpeptidase [Hydrogenophilus thiooxidans]|uniref:L,D-transpeptidase n=1 Tax=Hydrogenophilus thiooxidans TaxID=2820326 RepID=UPI001C249DC0|nr:L,D-transpeptidase [Hydrogenophilus thiooxidans]
MSAAKVVICVATQRLFLYDWDGVCQRIYPVSTARAGVGQRLGSGQTPLGRHRIRAVIGTGMPLGTVFKGRRPSSARYFLPHWERDGHKKDSDAGLAPSDAHDWILTRILWLCGEEVGWNRLGEVDTQRRYIYLHGTAEEEKLGKPCSHGCVRMRNLDIVELTAVMQPGTKVWIVSKWCAQAAAL